jgi:Tol biopolymer transport system component/DNA-binding winged helix-turn-helix (wHTH) protein
MSEQAKCLYEFGPFRLDTGERVLLRAGQPVRLTARAYDLLLALVEKHGHVVEKEELMRRVWSDSIVEEANLTVQISALRKALGEDSQGSNKYIETIPKRGYRFVMSVRKLPPEVELPSTANHIEAAELRGQKETGGADQINATTLPGGEELAIRQGQAGQTNRRKMRVVTAVVVIGLLTAAFGFYELIERNKLPDPHQKMKITRVTMNGKATVPALSPDGEYLAYALDQGGRQGIWLRHVPTGSDKQIIPPAEGAHQTLFLAAYAKLIFSPDGHYIYYSKVESKQAGTGAIYQVPVLGGAPRKVIDRVLGFLGGTPISFAVSPDGQRLAFVRYDFTKGETTLIVANTDGGGERVLSKHTAPAYLYSPAWSPDGQVIAGVLQGTDERGRCINIVGVAAERGTEKLITSQRWYVADQIGWLADGSGLVVTVMDTASSPLQIRYVSYPGSEVSKITNDLDSYRGVSLTADARTLVTVQEQSITRLWLIPNAAASRAKQITENKDDGRWGVAWTPAGEIIYSSSFRDGLNLWAVDPATGHTRQLTIDGAMNQQPAVSPDGQYIIFVSARAGSGVRNLWRMKPDGSDLVRLTYGKSEWHPSCSPDGRWVVYHSLDAAGRFSLWKVSIDGGTPLRLTTQTTYHAAVSPDGKMIACVYAAGADVPHKLAVFSSEGGQPVKLFDLSPTVGDYFRWIAEGTAVTYIDTINGVSNIWRQSLTGGPSQQLTNFQADQIISFDWSRNGKQLVVARGSFDSDVVLLKNFW